jgi:hypothetical protein
MGIPIEFYAAALMALIVVTLCVAIFRRRRSKQRRSSGFSTGSRQPIEPEKVRRLWTPGVRRRYLQRIALTFP